MCFEPAIYSTCDGHANNYTNNALIKINRDKKNRMLHSSNETELSYF